MLGRYDQARVQAETGVTLCREINFSRGIARSLLVLCDLKLADAGYRAGRPPVDSVLDGEVQRTHSEARLSMEECVATCRERSPSLLSNALATSSVVARGLGDHAEARGHLCEATRIAAETEAFPLAMSVLPPMALLLVDRAKAERAVELYALASRYGYVANSRWFEDVFGREIAAAAADLPPEVVAAAEERGRQRDLSATMKELLVELEGDVNGSKVGDPEATTRPSAHGAPEL